MDFEKDVTELEALSYKLCSQQFNASPETNNYNMLGISHESFMEIILHVMQKRSWWIILYPWYAQNHLLQAIEFGFYTPKTRKNAGFILIPLVEYRTTVVFAHKSCLNPKQFSAVMNQHGNGRQKMDIKDDKRDVVVILPFQEDETFEWIEKIQKEQIQFKTTDKGESKYKVSELSVPIKTKNPRVIAELKEFEVINKLNQEIMDYYLKEELGF